MAEVAERNFTSSVIRPYLISEARDLAVMLISSLRFVGNAGRLCSILPTYDDYRS